MLEFHGFLNMSRIKNYRRVSKVMSRLYRKAYFLTGSLQREIVAKKFLQDRLSEMNASPLTDVEKRAVQEYWNGYNVDNNWFWYYNRTQRNHEAFDVRYMPDDLFSIYVYDHFNLLREVRTLDDKNYYNLYFPDVKQPNTLVHIVEGQYLDEKYRPIPLSEAKARCVSCGKIVCKPAVQSAGGKGLVFWDDKEDISVLDEVFANAGNMVVQEQIYQHPSLAALHENSVNTIRVMTWFRDGKVEVLSTIVRIGVGGLRVDNISMGGLFCGVTDDGNLKKWGYRWIGEPCLIHPQGAVFETSNVIGVDKCIEVAKLLAYRVARVAKMPSWDFTVDCDGNPVFIEMNLTNGVLNAHQLANGPIFGDDTKKIVVDIMSKKRYRLLNKVLK